MLLSLCAIILSAGVVLQHDELRYHFDNPSSWDTAVLVPHFFEQTYSGSKSMLFVRAASRRWSIEAGATAVRSVRGTDYDTFFQPSGDIVVHGTSTSVRARSWRMAATAGGAVQLRAAFARDQFTFPVSVSTTTHSMPPSTASNLSTTRESTASDVVELGAVVTRSHAISPHWTVGGEAGVAPVTVARLTTNLPDKYEQPVRFTAMAFSAHGAVTAEWRSGRASIHLSAVMGQAWRYDARRTFAKKQAGVELGISLIPRVNE